MRIPYRQWQLWRMNRRLSRSDPHTAAMLAIFARLTVDEAMASREQAHPDTRVRRGLAWAWRTITGLAICVADCARWALRRVTIACAVVRWRLSGAQALLSSSLAARPHAHRSGPSLPAS